MCDVNVEILLDIDQSVLPDIFRLNELASTTSLPPRALVNKDARNSQTRVVST